MNLVNNVGSNLVSFHGLGSSLKSLFSKKAASAVSEVVQETSNAAVPADIALASLGIKVKKGSNVVQAISQMSDKKLTKLVYKALAEEKPNGIYKMPESLVTLLKEENLSPEKVESIIENIRK